jgi:SAM-dependent methyltransferase
MMARTHSGCEVWQQDFLKLDLPDRHFDGIFANAALFHIPIQELPRALLELHASLKPGGVLFSSSPHGHNEEGWNGERYGVYHDLDTWRRSMSAAGFVEINHYYRPPHRTAARKAALASKRLASVRTSGCFRRTFRYCPSPMIAFGVKADINSGTTPALGSYEGGGYERRQDEGR